jgi:hypothetical protein
MELYQQIKKISQCNIANVLNVNIKHYSKCFNLVYTNIILQKK